MSAPIGNNFAEGKGRPSSYDPSFDELAYNYCLLGATDAELATFFDVAKSTLNLWKQTHLSFSESVKRGKIIADAEVARAYHKRATGYEYTETTFEKVADKVTLEMTPDELITQDAYKKKVVVKQLPPDPGAALNWLKNRQPQKWREGIDINLNKGSELKAWTAEDIAAYELYQRTMQAKADESD